MDAIVGQMCLPIKHFAQCPCEITSRITQIVEVCVFCLALSWFSTLCSQQKQVIIIQTPFTDEFYIICCEGLRGALKKKMEKIRKFSQPQMTPPYLSWELCEVGN